MSLSSSDLKQGHFTDDGVVDVHSDVQSHLSRKLHQQLLFICRETSVRDPEGNVTHSGMSVFPSVGMFLYCLTFGSFPVGT